MFLASVDYREVVILLVGATVQSGAVQATGEIYHTLMDISKGSSREPYDYPGLCCPHGQFLCRFSCPHDTPIDMDLRAWDRPIVRYFREG